MFLYLNHFDKRNLILSRNLIYLRIKSYRGEGQIVLQMRSLFIHQIYVFWGEKIEQKPFDDIFDEVSGSLANLTNRKQYIWELYWKQ